MNIGMEKIRFQLLTKELVKILESKHVSRLFQKANKNTMALLLWERNPYSTPENVSSIRWTSRKRQ